MTFDYTARQTAKIQRTLLENGVAIDGTNMTVTLVLRDRADGLVPLSGNVAWLSQAAGTVTFTPAADDLQVVKSPYRAKWIVTDPQGLTAAFPQAEAEVWRIWP